jgi:hypothetical protein
MFKLSTLKVLKINRVLHHKIRLETVPNQQLSTIHIKSFCKMLLRRVLLKAKQNRGNHKVSLPLQHKVSITTSPPAHCLTTKILKQPNTQLSSLEEAKDTRPLPSILGRPQQLLHKEDPQAQVITPAPKVTTRL